MPSWSVRPSLHGMLGLSPTRTPTGTCASLLFLVDIHSPRVHPAAMTNYGMQHPITRQQREPVYPNRGTGKPRVCGWTGRDMQGVRVRTAGWTIPPARAARKQDAVQLLVLRDVNALRHFDAASSRIRKPNIASCQMQRPCCRPVTCQMAYDGLERLKMMCE